MGSRSSSAQATTNQDNRVAVSDGIGLSGAGNALNLKTSTTSNTTSINNVLDGGAVKAALDTTGKATKNALDFGSNTVSAALQTVQVNDATNAEGFNKLLDSATAMFNKSQGLIGQTQQAVAQAYSDAQNNAKGTIDNRTIIILGVAAAAALVMSKRAHA